MKRSKIFIALTFILAIQTIFTFDSSAKTPSKSIHAANHHIVKQLSTSTQATYNTYECVIDGIERTYKL